MRKLAHEHRVLLLAVVAGLPGSVVALVLLWTRVADAKVSWTLTVVIVVIWLGFASATRQRVVFPLQTISNLLAAMREEDFSIRARDAGLADALGEVMVEVNALGETLREQRLGALEATTLLRKVMEEIDVAVFTFDENHVLRLVNRAGERLVAQPAERILGLSAEELGLAACLVDEPARTVEMSFPGGSSRWGMRRTTFREGGLPRQLVVLSDVSRALREEERQAWQRLIRVLGHELNNSLAPIQSVAGSLESMVNRNPLPEDWQPDSVEDMRRGLGVIRARAEALSRFMAAYARLAKLPAPKLAPVEIEPLMRRVAGLETRLAITLKPGPNVTLPADSDQLEQLLINVIRNAVDATLETGGGVQLSWAKNNGHLDVRVIDEGPGLSNTSNLFVPFFTTKPGGSGIGLVLCRQIAEAHGGSLTLENRRHGRGCEARLRLPLE